jgi:hypothetical protein
MSIRQKMDLILENKMIQELRLENEGEIKLIEMICIFILRIPMFHASIMNL